MNPMKTPGLMLLVILLLIPACSGGSVPDQNSVTPPAQPFIAIDPVGNHTLDEVFFISGTTDLPASGTPLLLQIETTNFNPGGGGSAYQSNVTIEPGENGINTWSCNATTSLWQTYGLGLQFPIADAVPGEYLVIVVSPDPDTSANATRIFSILSSEETGNTTAANPEITPYHTNQFARGQRGYWISMDNLPLGTHFVGDTFGVSGETNLPTGQEIDYGAFSANYVPGSPNLLPPRFSGSTIVYQGTDEINTWSFVINTSRFEKTLENGSVVRMAAVAGNYELSIGPFNQELYPFTLADTTGTPTENSTHVPTSSATTQPDRQPTTRPAPLSLIIPRVSIGIGFGIIDFQRYRKD
ncbi:hypothetical protein [Methanoregula sp.]|uniref:hypothetical protein n=1 Tax=Methanoregula sp. TaxID=2052170 RepID=UPI003BB0CD0A